MADRRKRKLKRRRHLLLWLPEASRSHPLSPPSPSPRRHQRSPHLRPSPQSTLMTKRQRNARKRRRRMNLQRRSWPRRKQQRQRKRRRRRKRRTRSLRRCENFKRSERRRKKKKPLQRKSQRKEKAQPQQLLKKKEKKGTNKRFNKKQHQQQPLQKAILFQPQKKRRRKKKRRRQREKCRRKKRPAQRRPSEHTRLSLTRQRVRVSSRLQKETLSLSHANKRRMQSSSLVSARERVADFPATLLRTQLQRNGTLMYWMPSVCLLISHLFFLCTPQTFVCRLGDPALHFKMAVKCFAVGNYIAKVLIPLAVDRHVSFLPNLLCASSLSFIHLIVFDLLKRNPGSCRSTKAILSLSPCSATQR
eukprot:m.99587 g.99587  ORF g.99587 m.99587 type:complete len:361 (-) comp12536_c0_seq5:364-1446(-)